MANRDIQAARDFHTGTSHPGGHLFDPRHRYVPGREPLLAKIYPELPAIPLPLDRSPGEMHALAAISPAPGPPTGPAVPDLPTLARILYFTAGITKWLRLPHSRERQPFRAAACTGALYHIEVYVVSGDLPGLEAGVYHFDPIETALRRLRVGDHRRFLVHAAGSEPHVVRAPLAMVFTDVFARNAYKYQARAYRHAFWDSGTMISHTLAMAARHGLPARVVLGFIDTHISRLLGLRPEEELPLAIVPVGWSEQATSPTAEEPEPLRLRVHPISSPPLDSPAIWKTHHASSLTSVDEVAAWRAAAGGSERPQQGEGLVELPSLPPEAWPPAPVEQVILRRGSSREFSRHPIQRELAGTILSRALVRFGTDYSPQGGVEMTQPYLIAHAVHGLPPGAYVVHRDPPRAELVRQGRFRAEAGELALGQPLAADASLNVYFLADLERILARYGNRGYRCAQMEAAVRAGRVYLAAYALDLGATGLTFFDDPVTSFFSPPAAGKAVMFLIAVGVPRRAAGSGV